MFSGFIFSIIYNTVHRVNKNLLRQRRYTKPQIFYSISTNMADDTNVYTLSESPQRSLEGQLNCRSLVSQNLSSPPPIPSSLYTRNDLCPSFGDIATFFLATCSRSLPNDAIPAKTTTTLLHTKDYARSIGS